MSYQRHQIYELQKKYGTVFFNSDPKGATIYVDGQILIDPTTEESKKTPTSTLLLEGRRDIVFRIQGYDDIATYVDILPGTTVTINRNFKSKTGKTITPLQSNIQSLQENFVSNFTISFIGSLAAVYVAIKFLKLRE